MNWLCNLGPRQGSGQRFGEYAFMQVVVCAERDGATWYLPAELANVRDVCGAGDTVLATLGMGLARGESLRDTCKLAVMTAAEQVSQIGIAPLLNAALPA